MTSQQSARSESPDVPAVNRQEGTPGSTLELYRSVLKHRRAFGLGTGTLTWLPAEPGVVGFANGSVKVFVNTNDHAVGLPAGRLIVISESLLADGQLPANAAVWIAA